MTASPDFSGYLRAIATQYAQWWELYTPTDAIQLMVRTAQPRQTEQSPAPGERSPQPIEQFPVLEGIRKYAANHVHVLLSGKPGSGKSTVLRRLLLDEADQALRGETDSIPVLVELRGGKAIATLIQDTLRRHRLRLTSEQIDDLLFDSKLLLLVDGVNEIASIELLRDLEDFRANNPATPMIFTTRDLGLGGDLGIAKKLEMQPLNEPQMQEFVYKYLPEQGTKLLRQLQHRLRELCETPLLLKMLCDVFGYVQQIPQNKGELFRGFDREYDQFKRIDTISADLRRWKSELLQHLAFRMMQGKEATQPMLQIARSEAEKIIEDLLCDRVTSPGEKAKAWLEDLLEHHLLQVAGDRTQIEFHHQLFQEYYAAEYLLHQLPELLQDERRFQKEYLNLLKWTEAIALMLALVEDEGQAVRVVELAIGVDLMLGARLAGEVKPQFQPKPVNFITDLTIPPLLKVKFLEETHSENAIAGLLTALGDSDPSVRRRAAETLGKLNSEQAIPGLLIALEDQYWDVGESAAEAAVQALGKLNSEQAIPGLLTALKHQDSSVRWSAAEALGKLNSEQAIPGLLTALEHQDSVVRWRAAEALDKLKSKQAIPALLTALEDPDWDVRRSAAEALGKLNSEQVIPALLTALEDQEPVVRRIAAATLGKINSEQAISGLITALEHQDWDVRRRAAEALGKLNSEQAIPGLITALKDQDWDVRWSAVQALGNINSEQAIPGLITALEHQDSSVRKSAVWGLGNINSEQAVLELLIALKDPDSSVRRSAAEALGKLNSEQAIPGLLTALKDPDSSVRWSAADALVQLNSEQAIPGLLTALEDQDSVVRWSAAEALGDINSEQAIPGLLTALKDPDSSVRRSAAEALGKIKSEEAISALLKALDNQDSKIRGSAAEALGEIKSEKATLGLLKALKDQDSNVCWRAVEALGKIGDPRPLENLWKVQLNATSTQTHSAIASIQARCKFYNYEIFKAAEAIEPPSAEEPSQTIVNHYPNVQEVRIFEQVNTYNENNLNS